MLSNPFAALSASVSPAIMQTYVVMMALLVVAGTLFDIIHKQSATYFFNNWRDFKNKAKRPVGGGEMASLAVQTAIVDVMASGEFCNMRRRIAHLLTMYGFVIYVVTTIMMVFAYPMAAAPTPAGVAALWYIGGLMVCAGGYWFWFFIRVDVAAEGYSPFRFVHRLAGLERHFRLGVGRRTVNRQRDMELHIPWPVSPRYHGIIWIDPVV